MENAYIILLQIIKMFIMMFVGLFLYKKSITNDSIVGGLSSLLINVATPATLINSFLQEYSPEKIPNLLISFGLCTLIYVIAIVFAEILYKKEEGVDKFGVAFSNAGFIGIPLVSGVFGTKAVFYLAPVIVMFYVFCFTYGIYIMSMDKNEIKINKIITNPCILAAVIGILVFVLKIKLPSPIEGSISAFAGLNTPLAMLVLGAHIARGNFKDIFTNKKAYLVSAYRLILVPVVMVILFKFVPSSWNEIKTILLISLSAPIGALSPVFAMMYKRDAVYGAQTVCLSTLLSIITLPLIILLSQVIW